LIDKQMPSVFSLVIQIYLYLAVGFRLIYKDGYTSLMPSYRWGNNSIECYKPDLSEVR